MSAVIDGMNDSGGQGAGATSASQLSGEDKAADTVKNGGNMASLLSILETCRGDVGLTLTMPRQGLGNAAIRRSRQRRSEEALREPLGRDGDHRAGGRLGRCRDPHDRGARRRSLRPERREDLRHTAGEGADLVVVWASLDLSIGRAAIKFVRRRPQEPGMKLERLEHKLGIRASDTAAFQARQLPRAEGGSPRQPGSRRRPASAARCRRSTTRVRSVAAMALGGHACVPGSHDRAAREGGHHLRSGSPGARAACCPPPG